MNAHHPVVLAAITGLVSAVAAPACRTEGADASLRASVPSAAEPGAISPDTVSTSGSKMSCSAEMMGSAAPPKERGKMSCSPDGCGANMRDPAPSASTPATSPATPPTSSSSKPGVPAAPASVAPSSPAKSELAPLPSAEPAVPASASASAEKMACGGKMGCSPAMMGSK